YDDLLEEINKGDLLKVYYKSNDNRTENVNIDLIQIEKDGLILYDKKEYARKESALIYLGLIGALLTYVIVYRYYRYGSVFGNNTAKRRR
ncbi:MAG: hypothetical protein LBV47_00035, partial [Bacteroidales bacterium]|nr:hypothetical protein [Bacteroidales bacterium]